MAVAILALNLPGDSYQPTFQAGVAIVLWWTVLIGMLFGALPVGAVPRHAVATGAALAALGLLSAFSIAWAADQEHALEEAVRVGLYLGILTLGMLLFSGIRARAVLFGVVGGYVAVTLTALASRYVPEAFPEQRIADFLPSAAARLAYPVNYWNGLAAVVAGAFVGLSWIGAHGRSRAARAAACASLPAAVLALFLTSSRGGVVAVLVGLGVLMVIDRARITALATAFIGAAFGAALCFYANEHRAFTEGLASNPSASSEGFEMLVATVVACGLGGLSRAAIDPVLVKAHGPRVPPRTSAFAAAVLLIGLVLALDLPTRFEEFRKPPSGGRASTDIAAHLASDEGNGRWQFWEAGWEAFAENPVLGIGAGGYEAWWAERGQLPYFIRDAHSLYVETLAQLGLLGLACLGVALLLPLVRAIRLAKESSPAASVGAGVAALLAAALFSAAIDWTWELPGVFAGTLLLLAVGTRIKLLGSSPGPRAGFASAVGLAGCGWLAIIASGIVFVTSVNLAESREAAREGDLRQAVTDARAAEAVQPWAAGPRLQRALVLERAGELVAARQAIQEAIARSASDWRLRYVAARINVRAGDVTAAQRQLREARRLNPRSPLLMPGRSGSPE